jgi:hypothetical protein
MGEVISILSRLRLPKPPSVPSICPACGDQILDRRDGFRDGEERVHLTCAVSEQRQHSWLHERYGMRHMLRRSFSQLLGQERVQPIIEQIGDDERKPSQIYTALCTLQMMIKDPDAHINPFWLGAADAAVNACKLRLRIFLCRKIS